MQLRNITKQDWLYSNQSPLLHIYCISISLFVCLSIIRTNIIFIEWETGFSLLTYIPRVIIAAYYDFCFAGCLTLFFIFLLFLCSKAKKGYRIVQRFYYATVLLTGIIALLNKQIIRIIGNPFSYQWYYYSDFMGSLDAQNAMLANFSWKLLTEIIILSSLVLVLARIMMVTGIYLVSRFKITLDVKFYLLTGALFVIYSFVFSWYKNYKNWQYNQLANPVAFFIQSALKSDTSIPLFSMELNSNFEDIPGTEKKITGVSLQDTMPVKIQNVVIFVLESVPAEYVDVYGGKFGVTPQINKLIPASVWFKQAYAHSPSTNNAMVSILGSVYPWISFKSLTKEFPGAKLSTLSNTLKQKNYRTAFFNAGDIKFQRADEFLANQQFDKIEDFNSKHCTDKQFIVQGERWDNPDGADDACMVDAFAEWMDTGTDRPFFATIWTVQTHYPYFFAGQQKDYKVNNPDLNRYLNALHHSDQTLGKLMHLLKERGLDESTLVVIVGDHGEAFGRHKQFTHASKIYEENVHVPLIFINKQLFHGENSETIGGHIDIAPTIVDVLGFPVEEQWQGQSLFSNQRSNRAYFFAPWSDFLFGFRENNFKFIYNATRNSTEVYDLEKDPTEIVNLASQLPSDYVTKGHQRLASWIQYHDKFMKTSIDK